MSEGLGVTSALKRLAMIEFEVLLPPVQFPVSKASSIIREIVISPRDISSFPDPVGRSRCSISIVNRIWEGSVNFHQIQ